MNVENFVRKTSMLMFYTLEKGAVRIAYAHGWLTIKYSRNKKGTFFCNSLKKNDFTQLNLNK